MCPKSLSAPTSYGDQMPDTVRAVVGRADPARLGAGCPAVAAGLGLQVQRPELVQADHDRLPGVRERVELNDAVALGLELRVVGALPGPHGLKADAFLAQQHAQPFVGDVRHHPLSDQVVRQLRQAPGRKRLIEIGRIGQRDPLDLLALGQRERRRPAALVARIESVEAVAVEVVDHLADGVGIGEHHLADRRRCHALSRQQHDLRAAPRHHRTRRATHDPQQPLTLLIGDLPERHPGRHDDPSRSTMNMPTDSRSHPRLLDYANPANIAGCTTSAPGRRAR